MNAERTENITFCCALAAAGVNTNGKALHHKLKTPHCYEQICSWSSREAARLLQAPSEEAGPHKHLFPRALEEADMDFPGQSLKI